MERNLSVWVNRKVGEGIAVDKQQTENQALLFYKTICRKDGIPLRNFCASTGWLHNFIKCKGIRYLKITGESQSGDAVAVREFPEFLKKLLEERNINQIISKIWMRLSSSIVKC